MRRNRLNIFLVAFFLSCIDGWCLLSPSLSVRKSQPSSVAKCWSQRSGCNDGIKLIHNKTEELIRRNAGDNFPVAKTTKIKIQNADCDDPDDPEDFGLGKDIDDDSITLGNDDKTVDSFSKNSNMKSYFTLERLTEDLLASNDSVVGSWKEQDFEKVVNVIHTWSKRTGGPGRLQPALQQELLLRRVIEEKHAGNELAMGMNMSDIYHEIIYSWSKSHEIGSANRAEEILHAMQRAYNTGQDRDLQPTIDAWNSVIGSYAQSKSKDATQQAVRVFVKLHHLISEGKTDVRPNDDSYAYILKAVASSGEPDAPKKVLDLLVRMENLSENGFSIDVTSNCHNIYLTALVESMKNSKVSATETAQLAQSHLHKMKENPNPNAQPDRRSKYLH